MDWDNKDPIDNKLEWAFLKIFKDKDELSEVSPEAISHGAIPEEVIYQNWINHLSEIDGIEHSKRSGFSFPSVLHWMNHKLVSGEFVGKRVIRDLVGVHMGMWNASSCDFIIIDESLVDRILVLGHVA